MTARSPCEHADMFKAARTTSRRPHTHAAPTTGGNPVSARSASSCAARTRPSQQCQRPGDHRVRLPQQQRQPASGARRAHRYHAHPRRQRVLAGVHPGAVQAGPGVQNRHGAVFRIAGAIPADPRLGAQRGNHDHRGAGHVLHDAARLAGAGHHDRHMTEQPAQFLRGAGGADAHHAHPFAAASRAPPLHRRRAAPQATGRALPQSGQRPRAAGAAGAAMAGGAAQRLVDAVMGHRQEHRPAFQSLGQDS